MLKVKIYFSISSTKYLNKIDKKLSNKIFSKIYKYAQSPNSHRRAKKLKGGLKDRYRYRIGNHRVIFKYLDFSSILILRIGHRKDVYKK